MRHLVFSQINAVFFRKAVCDEVDHYFVKVVSAESVVAVGSKYFEYAVAQFQYGYVERTAAQIVY